MFKKLLPIIFLFAGFQVNATLMTTNFQLTVEHSGHAGLALDETFDYSLTWNDATNEMHSFNDLDGSTAYTWCVTADVGCSWIDADNFGLYASFSDGVSNFEGLLSQVAADERGATEINGGASYSRALRFPTGPLTHDILGPDFSFALNYNFNSDVLGDAYLSTYCDGLQDDEEDTYCPNHVTSFRASLVSHVVAEEPTASVPEPSIIALFGAGLVGLGFARRRKSRQV